MAKLSAKTRKNLPASDFAGPNRSYPVNDKGHAIAAKGMAARFASPAVKAKVDAKANKMLGKSDDKPKAMKRCPGCGTMSKGATCPGCGRSL